MTTMHVEIQRVSDGAVRVFHWENWHAWREGEDYWWRDGNMSCDCNRESYFRLAGDETLPLTPQCGRGRFVIKSITYDDSPEVFYSDMKEGEQ